LILEIDTKPLAHYVSDVILTLHEAQKEIIDFHRKGSRMKHL
jgi:DNA-binding protein